MPSGGQGAVNGALDPTFGTGGESIVRAGSGSYADALALGPDRRAVAAGQDFSGNLLLFRVLGDPFRVTVARAGSGTGTVQSAPGGIACGAACSAPFDDGSAVTLTATPGAGSTFAGWSGGGCSGVGSCTLTMSGEQAVTARFDVLPPSPPRLTALRESNSTFRAGRASTSLRGSTAKARHRRGTVFSFQLDKAASVKIAITHPTRGRRVGHRCVAAAPRLRGKPSCRRTVTVSALTRTARAGRNRVSFSGRLKRRALAPGRYRAIFTATDSAGSSAAKALQFRIVRR